MSGVGALRFTLAQAKDEPALRQLLRAQPLPGWVSLSFQREPNYFQAAGIEGDRHRVLLAWSDRHAAPIAMHSRSVRSVYVDGNVRKLGYLGGLRTDPAIPAGRWRVRLMREGFQAGRELLRQRDELPYDLTAIVYDNLPARRLLEAGLSGLPRYTPFAPWCTLAFATGALRRRCTALPSGYTVRDAQPDDRDLVVALLARHHQHRPLAPVWDAQTLESAGLELQDFSILEQDGAPVGCAAIWDQRAFKQMVVRTYRMPLGMLRGINNLMAPLTGLPRLPRPGQTLAQAWMSQLALDAVHTDAAPGLLRAVLDRARRRNIDQILLGLAHEHDARPMLQQRFRALAYRSVLYLVHWPDAECRLPRAASGQVYVETATL